MRLCIASRCCARFEAGAGLAGAFATAVFGASVSGSFVPSMQNKQRLREFYGDTHITGPFMSAHSFRSPKFMELALDQLVEK